MTQQETVTTAIAVETHKADIQQVEADLIKLVKNKNDNNAMSQKSHDSRLIRWHFYALNDFECTACLFLGFFLSTLIALIYSAYIAQGSFWHEFGFVCMVTLMIVYASGAVFFVVTQFISESFAINKIKKLLDKDLSNEAKGFVNNEISIYELKMQKALELQASHPSEYDYDLIKALDEDYRTQLVRNLVSYGKKLTISIGHTH